VTIISPKSSSSSMRSISGFYTEGANALCRKPREHVPKTKTLQFPIPVLYNIWETVGKLKKGG